MEEGLVRIRKRHWGSQNQGPAHSRVASPTLEYSISWVPRGYLAARIERTGAALPPKQGQVILASSQTALPGLQKYSVRGSPCPCIRRGPTLTRACFRQQRSSHVGHPAIRMCRTQLCCPTMSQARGSPCHSGCGELHQSMPPILIQHLSSEPRSLRPTTRWGG